MADIINNLQEELIIKTFAKLQLSIFQNVQNNSNSLPCGRRYTDDVKEFSLTLYFYSPKAYQYVRSILPLPNPSLIWKWSSSIECEPGFLGEAFQALSSEVSRSPEKKTVALSLMPCQSESKQYGTRRKTNMQDS